MAGRRAAPPCPKPARGGIRCKSRKCPGCGVLWAGDTRRKLLVNVESYGGPVAMITATAPGRDQLPDMEATARWNSTAASRWRAWHRTARAQAERGTGTKPTMLAWSWEYQRRGALHKHVLLGMKSAPERRAAHAYALALEATGWIYGFGFVSDSGRGGGWRQRGLKSLPCETAGRYVAKYLTPLGDDGKPAISETARRPDVPPLVVYVAAALTAQTGCTMRWLRWVRHAWVLGVDPWTGEVVDPGIELDDDQAAMLGTIARAQAGEPAPGGT